MDARTAVARSPSTADLKRQPSTSRLASAFAAQIPVFQRTRSRSAITVESSLAPKLIVPMRAAHSAHGSNNSASRRGRNSQSRNSQSRNSQSRKAHPSESRYSDRSYRDKSSRRHEVEVEDLGSDAPPPVLLKQDSSVYPSAAAARHAATPSPPVDVRSGSSDRPAAAHEPTSSSISPSSSSNGYTPTSVDRILWAVKALLYTGLGVFYAVSATVHEVFPEAKCVAALRVRLLVTDTSSASRQLYLAACIGFACVHFGSLLQMVLAKVARLKQIRVAPMAPQSVVPAVSADKKKTVDDEVQAFGSNSSSNAKVEESSLKKQVDLRPPSQPSIRSRKNPIFGLVSLSLGSYQRLLESESSAAFELEYLKLRLVQLVVHTGLAANMSSGISSLSLNQLYTAAVVLSCWVPALIQLRTRRTDSDSVHKRLGCVAAASILDVVAVVVIPLGILGPYTKVHNELERFSPIPSQYSDSWLVTMLLDSQFLDGNSLSHVILSILLGANIVLSLQVSVPILSLSSTINRKRSSASSITQVGPGRTQSASKVAVGGQRSQAKSYAASDTRASRIFLYLCQSTLGRRLQSSRLSLTALGLLAWGFVVLICHLAAVSRSQMRPSGCLVHTFPWSQSQPACALLKLSCVAGEPQSLTSLLVPLAFDDQQLRYLVISDCERLQLTTRLREFRGLVGLRIRNSSLVFWDANATLSSLHHPNLRMLSLSSIKIASNSTISNLEDPENPLEALRMVHLCGSSLASLPVHLDNLSRWRNLVLLYLELAGLSQFPSEVLGLPLLDLSLSENAIKNVPKELFEAGRELTRLWLNGNPISELPSDDKLQVSSTMTLLSLDSIKLSMLPSWLSADFGRQVSVYLGGTPLCSNGSIVSGPALSCTAVSAPSCT